MSNLLNWKFKPYNKEELFDKINQIDISRNGNQIITKYYGRIVKTANVTKRYEIFDIKSFLIEKINQLEKNFKITYYRLYIRGGVQELTLLSDSVTINETTYYKSFFILNSSDKSRRLNMNLGLFREDNNTYLSTSIQNFSIHRKHITGITEKAESVTGNIDVETFDEQIKAIKSLVGETVMLSKVRDIIIDKDLKINHRKFDAFKNLLMYSRTDKIKGLTDDQWNTLRTYSTNLTITPKNDFAIDAYKIFNCYIQVFARQDSYVVRKETERILKITTCFIRDSKINDILGELV